MKFNFNFNKLYIYFLFLALLNIFFSTDFVRAKTFSINDIEISTPFEINFNKNNIIDKGFILAFDELILSIVQTKDQKKLQKTSPRIIKGMIETFSINEEKFIDEIYYLNLNVSFNKKKIFALLEKKNILKEKLDQTKASAIITTNNYEIVSALKKLNISNIIVKNPRIAFAEVLDCLYKSINFQPGIHASAVIDKTAIIGADCHIGPNVYIGENTVIGDNNRILPGSSILGNVRIGNNNIIHPNCVIYENTTLKNNCVIYSNSVIGSEGFGFIPKNGKWVKMPQKGGVKIMSFVEIGTNCCIDRPAVGFTFIDEGTKLDNLIHLTL